MYLAVESTTIDYVFLSLIRIHCLKSAIDRSASREIRTSESFRYLGDPATIRLDVFVEISTRFLPLWPKGSLRV